MAKRTAQDVVDDVDSDIDVSSTDSESESENETTETGTEVNGQSKEDQEELINVDFDYFDFNPEIDFHSVKTLVRQLFGDDHARFDVSSLADAILTKNAIGTTIKTEGIDGDPFAMVTVLPISSGKKSTGSKDTGGDSTRPCIRTVVDYVLEKTAKDTEFQLMLRKVLNDGKAKVGWIVSERVINMPVETIPPMYKMLVAELEAADESCDYYVIVSKVYELVAGKENGEEEDKQSKKKKKSGETVSSEMDYFHYEDMVLEQNALYHGNYKYSAEGQETDSRRVFTEYGIDPRLSVILIDKKGLERSVPEMEQRFPPF